ncbi:amino acid adenylation domain-containing protein [Sorangium sp. So ce296]|uniref:amino acid adenylation domain-containing protein n=1 Tax=Sorangium sp. So ce296 TaxID=3133296 RepID=UPI003F62A513
MPVAGIIEELKTLGVDLWTESGQLRFRAPKGLLTEEKMTVLRAYKAQIIDFLATNQGVVVIADEQGRHEPFPLTDVQTAYLLGRQSSFGYGGVACHGYLEVTYPDLDPARLADAWNLLIERHDMLRAVIEQDGYQRVLPTVPRYHIKSTDVRGASAAEEERAISAIRAEMDHRMYETTAWPLFELRHTRTSRGDVVHFSLDSLIADWASAGIFFEELDLILAGRGDELRPLDLRFRDYILAERRLRETGRYQRDRQYWLGRVDDLPPAPELPTLPSSADAGPVRFRRHHSRLSAERWERLRQRAGERGLTASIAVLAAYAAVLQRWTRRQRFSLNLTLLNRLPLHAQVDRIVGDFTSVSLLDVRAQSGRSFKEWAARLGDQMFADLDHRLFTGVEALREITRRRGREAALMPVVFTSAIGLGPRRRASSGRRFGYGVTQTPQVYLDCQVMDDAEGLEVNWDVRQGTFPEGLIEDMFAALQRLLLDLAERPEAWDAVDPVALPEWQAQERARVNQTSGPLPDSLLHRGFLEQAARNPDSVAVVGHAGSLTYGDLAMRSASVAQALRDGGCAAGDRVAIVMSKGIEQVVAVLGVLLAGGTYLPLDATQPRLRIEKVLSNAAVRQVLTQSWISAGAKLPEGLRAIDVDTLAPAQSFPAAPTGDPDALAYVIYTSGSTGDPKGVMITHRAALNTIEDINRRFGVTGSDRVLGLAQLGFDLSVYDIFGTLALGGTLVLPDPDRGADPSHWADLIVKHEVTLWNSVPAQLQMLTSYLQTEPVAIRSLRMALLSGDWIPVTLPDQIRRFVPYLTLIGLGGATEAAIWSNYHRIERVDPGWASIPYGVPLANQGFRVLDESLRDAPVWVPGELYITGHGLAAGYLGDPELTAARFFNHPVDGQRLYRTGDLGRYLPGGSIEFLGREDSQVKIRGHRIELGEIEAALLAHPAIGAAAAVVAGKDHADRALLGFVELARRSAPTDAGPATSLGRLVSAARQFADNEVGGVTTAQVIEVTGALHEASFASMLSALVERGLFESPRDTHSAEEILRAARVHDRHHWLVRRWLGLLVEAGWLAYREDSRRYAQRRAVDATAVHDAWRRVEELASRSGLCTPEFVQYHKAHVERLHALLKNEQNPFELLFPRGKHDVALAVYRDDAIARYNNHAVAALLYRIAAARTDGAALRVIEIGAGTGATSGVVIPMLDGHDVDYLFTDLTAFFLAEARERFRERPWVRFGQFDLNEDYRAQGLLPNSADVVLCAGMLNSTRNIEAAVAAAVELLGPGGWLVFTEPTADLPHVLLTQGFMMDPAGADRERGSTKFLSTGQWQSLIEKCGGELVLRLPDDDHPMAAYGMHMFAARFKADRARVSTDELTSFLGQRLPGHMVPAHLQIVDRLPLTANGKVNRKALAAWRPAAFIDSAGKEADATLDELESRLCALWASALGIARIGKDENFYDRGADSLILARVAGRLREEVPEAAPFAYDTLLRQMLNEPTVDALARALRRQDGAAPAPGGAAPCAQATSTGGKTAQITPRREGSNSLIISFGGGDGPARVMFHAALGTMDYFQHLGRALAAQNLGPVLGFAVADPELYLAIPPKELVARVSDDYAQRLIDEGFTRFQLIGYCLGGLLATEVARRLLERGMSVDLALVDSIPMFIETDEELAFEAIFAPNLNLDPVKAVFGDDVDSADVYRAIEKLMVEYDRKIPAGAMAKLGGDPGLDAVAAAVRRQSARSQEERLAGYAKAAAAQAGVPVGPELIPALFRTCRHSMRAARFDPEPYVGDMTFLRCDEEQSFGITAGVGHLTAPFWEGVCLGEFKLIDVPGNHFSVIEPPHVNVVAAHLAASLDRK